MLNRLNEETNKYEYAQSNKRGNKHVRICAIEYTRKQTCTNMRNRINEETNKYEYAQSNKRGNKHVRICSIE